MFEVTRALAFVARHGATYRERPEVQGPNIRANVEQGLAMSLEDVARAMRRHTELYRAFLDFMADYDVLICPAMAVPPFPHRERYVAEINGQKLRTYFHWLALPYGLTLTASPVACIPCGRDHDRHAVRHPGLRQALRRPADAEGRRGPGAPSPDHPGTRPPAARPRRACRIAPSGAAEHEGLELLDRGGAGS